MTRRQLLHWPTAAGTGHGDGDARVGQVPGRPLRPLPRTVAPYQDETLASYQRRLALANHLDVYHHLRLHLNEHNASLTNAGHLAALAGQPLIALLYALPELREHDGQAHAGHVRGLTLTGRTRVFPDLTEQRPACRRCTAARGIRTEVLRWVRHDQNVCLRHRLWIGPDVLTPREQADLTGLPDLLSAQRRHDNLIRRRGHAATHAAFRDADAIIRSYVQAGTLIGHTRLATLTGQGHASLPDHPWLRLLTYPETVALTSALARPHWRQRAATDSADVAPGAFRAELQCLTDIHNLGDRLEPDPLDTWWKSQRPRRGYKQSHRQLHAYAATVSLERW